MYNNQTIADWVNNLLNILHDLGLATMIISICVIGLLMMLSGFMANERRAQGIRYALLGLVGGGVMVFGSSTIQTLLLSITK